MLSNRVSNTIPLSKTTKFIVDNRGKTVPTVKEGIALIATNCVTNESLYPSYEKLRYVSEETYRTWFRSHPEPGDILLTNKGSQNGAICLVPNPVNFVIGQDMVALRADEKVIDPLFLFAALRSPDVQRQIKNLDVSGVIPHFKKTDFDKLYLPYPDRHTQEMIGRTYFDFSAKIELNQRMNQTLEAMARAIFQSWFVDFDPVRAKSEGREPDLPKHIADLFPDRFEDSELGEIPAGWEVGPILKQAKLLSGGTPKTDRKDYWDGDVLWASAKDVSQCGQTFLIEPERTITKKGLEESATQLIPTFCAVVVARGATTGRMVLFGCEMAMNQTCYGLASTTQTPFALYCRLRFEMDDLVHAAHGSVFDTITTSTFANSKVVLPSIASLKAFEQKVAPIFRRILAATQENQILSILRDSLLPKLVSGELRIRNTGSCSRLVGD